MNAPADLLLSRLDGVKANGKDKYLARCSACNSKTQKLSVKVCDDGTILVKCWKGCSALSVVQSVGLELKDLFPRQAGHHNPKQAYHNRLNASYKKLLKHLSVDLTVVLIAASDIIGGKALTTTDMKRLVEADQRIRKILAAANA